MTRGYLSTIKIVDFFSKKQIRKARTTSNVHIESNENGEIVYSHTKEKLELSPHVLCYKWEVLD